MNFIKNHPKLSIGLGIALPSLLLAKSYFNGGVCQVKGDLKGKVAIVTGGNNGIGKETVKQLAARGATVVLGCRSKERALEAIKEITEELKSQQVNFTLEFIRLDLSSQSSIKEFCENFKKHFKTLDILVNNAGVSDSKFRKTAEGFESVFGVNHLGTFAVTLNLMDVLAATPNSRIVTVSSMMHYYMKDVKQSLSTLVEEPVVFKGNFAYGMSKLANILFTQELQRRIDEKNLKIQAVALHPGAVRTDIFNNMKPMLKAVFFLLTPVIFLTFQNTYYGAQTSLYCAIENYDQLTPGGYYTDCQEKPASKDACDLELGRELFTLSEQWTNLKF